MEQTNIEFTEDISGLSESELGGFFVGWPTKPSPLALFRLLQSSSHRWLAVHKPSGKVIGYCTALTDGVIFGYISSLEVLPDWQSKGIGTALVQRMLDTLGNLYAVDLVCDADVQPFYERCGFLGCSSMVIRRRDRLRNI